MRPTFARPLSRLLFWCLFLGGVLVIVIRMSSVDDAQIEPLHDNLLIDNVTQLNPVRVAKVITPTTTEEIITAITHTRGPVSIGGGRYSQGGQVAYPDSLHIDMRQFNQVLVFDKDKKQITVQAGIRWRDIQDYIDPHNLSLKIMQTYANFTVGGSLSVNVHGRYVGEGPLVKSVERIKLILANGDLKVASPSENPELFYAAIGGYGGIGVITEATLQLEDNQKVARTDVTMPVVEYKKFFFEKIRDDPHAVFTNADIYPPAYEQLRSVTWYNTQLPLTEQARLIPRDAEYFWGPKVVDWIADYDIGLWLREYVVDPIIYASSPVVWRNYEASYDVRELEPESRLTTTYALREYFVPVEKFDEFLPKMRAIFQAYDVTVINVSVRHAHRDPGTLLAWAKTEVFAFVVYYRQGTSGEAQQVVELWTRAMNDAAIELGGAYYLPYQVYETPAQFMAAYPRAQEFFALKKAVDPQYRFRNQLWAKVYVENDNVSVKQ
ncbi:FAD-binding protein [Cellvibrio fontiphilus]|uniref:FAD-dependent oxidoreductase n=1 Tax=Cellvibrio fontiphilus TaxID=1815559 RepID=A0ABV7FH84_9GAMM